MLTFPNGLPGFEACQRFALMDQSGLAPVIHLQSLEIPELCFLAVPIQRIDPAYRLALLPDDARTLELTKDMRPLVLALLAAEDGRDALTANLMAPVVVNLATRVAVQAVREDARYSHRHPLAEVATCS